MNTEITIQKEVSPIVKKAKELVIENANDMVKAGEMLSVVNKLGDRIEEEKSKVMRPLLDAQKAERARWKPAETDIDEARDEIRGKMSKFQTEQKRIADAEAARISARVGDGKGKLQAHTAARKVGEIDRPADTVSSDSGTVKFRTKPNFELIDITKVPFEFLELNEKAIREAIKTTKKIPGLRVFEEEIPVNYR